MTQPEILLTLVLAVVVVNGIVGILVYRGLKRDMWRHIDICIQAATGKRIVTVVAKPPKSKPDDQPDEDDPDAYDPILCGRRP